MERVKYQDLNVEDYPTDKQPFINYLKTIAELAMEEDDMFRLMPYAHFIRYDEISGDCYIITEEPTNKKIEKKLKAHFYKQYGKRPLLSPFGSEGGEPEYK